MQAPIFPWPVSLQATAAVQGAVRVGGEALTG